MCVGGIGESLTGRIRGRGRASLSGGPAPSWPHHTDLGTCLCAYAGARSAEGKSWEGRREVKENQTSNLTGLEERKKNME